MEEKEEICEFCMGNNVNLYCHCSLTANLARVDEPKMYDIVSNYLQETKGIPASVVVHVGQKGTGIPGTLQNISDNINKLMNDGILTKGVFKRIPYSLLLENSAGQKNSFGHSWEEIRKIYEGIDTTKVGLCLDTAHAFASGMCDFKDHESVVKLFDNAEEACGGIHLIHLNDSKVEFKKRVDRHEVLTKGHIWSSDITSLESLVGICVDRGIDMVSETADARFDINLVSQIKENL